MPKPDYATPERLGELIPPNLVHNALLCPHCRHVLYVGEKLLTPADRPQTRRPPKKGASRSKPPQ